MAMQARSPRVPLPLVHIDAVPFVGRWAYLLWRLHKTDDTIECVLPDAPLDEFSATHPFEQLRHALYRAVLLAELCFARCLNVYEGLPLFLNSLTEPHRHLCLSPRFRYSEWRPERILFGMLSEFWQTTFDMWVACQRKQFSISSLDEEPSKQFQEQLEKWVSETLSQVAPYFRREPWFVWHVKEDSMEESLVEHPVGKFRQLCEQLFCWLENWNATPYRLTRLLPEAAELIELMGELVELLAVRCRREMEEDGPIFHPLYQMGDWHGLPWQDVQPYQLMARLLYLQWSGRDDRIDEKLEALERGELKFRCERRFDPVRWLTGLHQEAPVEDLSLDMAEPEVQGSWLVGLFFYQLPWEWYRLVNGAEVGRMDSPLCGIAPSLLSLWDIWFDLEIVLSCYSNSFYPAVAIGWSEKHRERLEKLVQEYLQDYQAPTWWLALQVEGRVPFGAYSPILGAKEQRVLEVIENAFKWLVKFVSVPYEAWSLHWVLLEVIVVFRGLLQGWIDWLRQQGD
jgi:hypothetical protein